MTEQTILVIGGTGKTGRRVAARLADRGVPVRAVSRSSEPAFDWTDPSTWEPALRGVASAYVTYSPDLAFPGGAEAVDALATAAVRAGVRRLVLLSGRGEEGARHAEKLVRESGAEWTIVRASFFFQNFSESLLLESVRAGVIAFPAGTVAEPFVDAEDIADVAVAALTEDRHAGQVYELTGPRALTFAEVAAEISKAAGREVAYVPMEPEPYTAMLVEYGMPAEEARLLADLFATVLDGRNALPADGVRRALGREPRDFTDYAVRTAATGIWS